MTVTATAPIRAVTQNVFMPLSPAQATADIEATFRDGDVIGWQEIRPAGHREAIRDCTTHETYWGHASNGEPISWRKDRFRKVTAGADVLHPANPLFKMRWTVWVALEDKVTGLQFVVTNVHLVAGAFNNMAQPDKAMRVRMWNAGISNHLTFLASRVEAGLPVIALGDYNRQLKRHPALGDEVAGRPVRYHVAENSIDIVATIAPLGYMWTASKPERLGDRHSDHAGRRCTVTLHHNSTITNPPVPAPAPVPAPTPAPAPGPSRVENAVALLTDAYDIALRSGRHERAFRIAAALHILTTEVAS